MGVDAFINILRSYEYGTTNLSKTTIDKLPDQFEPFMHLYGMKLVCALLNALCGDKYVRPKSKEFMEEEGGWNSIKEDLKDYEEWDETRYNLWLEFLDFMETNEIEFVYSLSY
jgi:hypothetical protein